MARLSRAEAQERNRAKVLGAARDEFTERGFRDAKIDVIAERAELTRGAVYSNFPGKRALYFAVLAEEAERVAAGPAGDPGLTPGEALGALARAWVARLPLATDPGSRLGVDLVPEILADELTHRPYAQLMRFEAIVLGLALERLAPAAGRLVRVAELALTTLHGASRLAAAAPGFGEPFNVVRSCESLPSLGLADTWPDVPPIVAQPRPVDEPWVPPAAFDSLHGRPAPLTGDGVIAVLGLHRLSAVEEAVRAAPPDATVTVAVVTGSAPELAPLTHLVLAEVRGHLRQSFPAPAWPRLQVVRDDAGALASAAGVSAVSDATETAVRVRTGRVVLRAEGFGACHAAAAG
ncbi:TetR/AcrR family transcriptional regulator [Amycolatopsis sp. FDAARGOS 1241]|uniref:TetR/AcrR family transcriptional regulator n=1 Tax=Amycolatopsis sp. FDAARGOS 1241 TaxID=2778070 RepID=UPI00194E7D6D|nr:TetR/AcrR family transcriptional regulator [Amycolatopsis sp. FDAARGOS 1241]QRP43545.1 TetR/AcrR family transcriptional regulator [Amycolatopsis sp. FDAARGOS 1241]